MIDISLIAKAGGAVKFYGLKINTSLQGGGELYSCYAHNPRKAPGSGQYRKSGDLQLAGYG